MSRNKGGRPPKNQGQKIKQAHIRLTEDQHKQLLDLENQIGVNRTDLFIKRVLENQDYIVTQDVIVQLAKVGAEMGKIGSNINQLAKHANTVIKNQPLSPAVVGAFNSLLELHIAHEADLYKVLRQMYRVMKK
ncbi:MAG: plasmid mobilization relaxosome protein MobC [Mucilaginibacter sp.]|uniref:plasmid mobilization protein n=1 Tax=Mucilaginibacter sp. TaxID=1882438 RepID=UPI0031A60906